MATQTLTWWAVLSTVAGINVLFWAFSAHVLRPRLAAAAADPFDRDFRRLQLLLSAGYVAGCAWRSVMPVFDVPRLVLVDSWFSRVIVGRSVATVAELCFAAQWALLLRAAGQTADSRGVPLRRAPDRAADRGGGDLFVARGADHGQPGARDRRIAMGVCATLVVLGLLWTGPRLHGRLRLFAWGCSAAGAVYAAYMFGVDVPMYWARWLEDEAQGRVYLGMAQGLADASTRWTVTHDWAHWRSEVIWMTAYFSVAVWISIGLAHTPAWSRAGRNGS